MTILSKIFFILLVLLSAGTINAQIAPAQEETREVKFKKTESAPDPGNTNIIEVGDKQDKNKENNNGSVKQVKSARPDMSRSRGARPPDIVRPSGSRIPRGVGRPAGAGRHGRG
jgi:hypothetical protein